MCRLLHLENACICTEPSYSNKKLNNDIHVKKIKILLKSFDLLNFYYTLVIEIDWAGRSVDCVCFLYMTMQFEPCSLGELFLYSIYSHSLHPNWCFKSTYSFTAKIVPSLVSGINVPMASLTLASHVMYKCMQTTHTDMACIILLRLFLRSTWAY